MFALLAENFEGVTQEQFDLDLAAKNRVIWMERAGKLVGFSTLQAYETSFRDEPVSVVYSGDTIVGREAWGSTVLARSWIAAVNQLRTDFPRGKYYWLLLTSGFRTYRFLPLFWREFFPRHDMATPPEATQLLNHLAAEQFGNDYETKSGIVCFARPQRLREELACIPDNRLSDAHVSFFLTKNPRHDRGDELVCLTELTPSNLTRAGERMVRAR